MSTRKLYLSAIIGHTANQTTLQYNTRAWVKTGTYHTRNMTNSCGMTHTHAPVNHDCGCSALPASIVRWAAEASWQHYPVEWDEHQSPPSQWNTQSQTARPLSSLGSPPSEPAEWWTPDHVALRPYGWSVWKSGESLFINQINVSDNRREVKRPFKCFGSLTVRHYDFTGSSTQMVVIAWELANVWNLVSQS